MARFGSIFGSSPPGAGATGRLRPHRFPGVQRMETTAARGEESFGNPDKTAKKSSHRLASDKWRS